MLFFTSAYRQPHGRRNRLILQEKKNRKLPPDSTLLMTTGIDRDVLVLADAAAEPSLESAVQVLKKSSSGSRR